MVHMSYDVACEPDPWQLMHLSQLISRERNPELREALEDVDEFMNGYKYECLWLLLERQSKAFSDKISGS